jgi:hypothetical protein
MIGQPLLLELLFLIPHGLYDIRDNVGYIQISTTHHTSEFPCDSIPYWWNTYGKVPFYGANSILL